MALHLLTVKYILESLYRRQISYLTTAGLAQLVEHLTAEQEVVGLVPRDRPIFRGLKITEK